MRQIPRLAWRLLVLGLTGAVAGLSGFHGPMGAVDLGATCTAVFALTPWIGAWLFARNPDGLFPCGLPSQIDGPGPGFGSW